MAKSQRVTTRTRQTEGNTAGTTATPQSVGDTTAAVPERDRVATRAYELYKARGGSDGQALEDWLAAERELGAEKDERRSE